VKGIYLSHYEVDRYLSVCRDGLFRQDILTGWAIDNATELKTKPPRDPQETKKKSRLILGAWNHFFRITPEREEDMHHAKDFNIGKDQFEWLYEVVAQEKVPAGEVRACFIGTGEWKQFDTWPVRPQKEVSYYLTVAENKEFPDAYTLSGAKPSVYNIRTGITTLAYRNNRFGPRQTYTPGEIVALNIKTLPVTWQIKPGSRLRIDITSTNFPEYSIHSNYPGVWSEQTQTREANQTIYAGPKYPGNIHIPVIESK
jgi:predicted acyl esterase